MNLERSASQLLLTGTLLTLGGCTCSASASLETSTSTDGESVVTPPSPRPTEVIPAEASAIPTNIPTFLVDHCLARFTRETELLHPVSGNKFETVQPGDVRVISQWKKTPRVLHITPEGVREYRIESKGPRPPFESNCQKGETESHFAVFVDSTVYETDAFSRELCTLPRGTVSEDSTPSSDYLTDRVVHLSLGSLAPLCKDEKEGFFRSEGKTEQDPHRMHPVHTVLAPKKQ